MSKHAFIKSSGNVFKDVGFNNLDAKMLKFRSHLMSLIIKYIHQEKLTQKEAAQRLKVTQPRISNLLHGKIDLFSTGMLLDMIERTGFPIYKKIEADVHQFFKKYKGQHGNTKHL